MYVILKLLFNKNLPFGVTEENSKSFWSNLHLISLTCHFGGLNSSQDSQVCHIMVYGSNYLRKHWQTIHFFLKKHGKYDYHSIIMVWIVENMVIIPSSCRESWWPCQETWPPCRHHGMIMTMFRHDHGMIMARSWHGSHVFPTRALNEYILPNCSKILVEILKEKFFKTLSSG